MEAWKICYTVAANSVAYNDILYNSSFNRSPNLGGQLSAPGHHQFKLTD